MGQDRKESFFMGKNAVYHMYDFISWATKLTPEEAKIMRSLCKKNGRDIFKQEQWEEKKDKIRKEQWKKVSDTKIIYKEFNLVILKEDTGPLTEKELEVLNLLMLGYDREDLTEILHLSITTITTHIHNIYEKKQVSTMHQLMVKVFNPQLCKFDANLKFEKFKKSDILELQDILGGN